MTVSKPPEEQASVADVPRHADPGWWIYRGTGRPIEGIDLAEAMPPPPPWRDFDGGPLPEPDEPPPDDGEAVRRLGRAHHRSGQRVSAAELDMVNAALFLRRPLLVTGRPGTGKSTLAYRIARELGLGRVLRWSITSRTTLKSGLYEYDAIGRVQAAGARSAAAGDPGASVDEPPIGEFLRLGVLGTALLPHRLPRVLLIDELDKSEVDLPNDLLGIFEEAEFPIPELERIRNRSPELAVFTDDPDGSAIVAGGRVRCRAFPVVVITSNGEREFPPAFLRRCLRLEMPEPDAEQLAAMVVAHLLEAKGDARRELIEEFVRRSAEVGGGLPADKLLDAVYLATSGAYSGDGVAWPRLMDALWQQLSSAVR
ncbi:AAA family ATPase [Amycolatopsis sp. NPDC058278]|uniref:AAA family ATPase n=1 Tax=Amycolatopsis sp. NPDC058278 TaxID=3346417 RepID=UPI0036DB12D8